jgi:hypothetical protein
LRFRRPNRCHGGPSAQFEVVDWARFGARLTYGGTIDASWGCGTRGGVERFNKLANLDLNSDEPQQATLDALKAWNGSHCPGRSQKSPTS